MAKWKLNNQATGTKATFQYDSGTMHGDSAWSFEQDEKPFIEQAKRDREASQLENNSGMKKFATIPDLVAMEINYNYGIDLHDPTFMQDDDKKAKFFQIIRQDYPFLVVNS